MIYYLLLLLTIIVSYAVIQKITKKENKNIIFLNVAFVEMLLFIGLRDITVGTDLKNYIPYFNLFKESDWNILFTIKLEPGYIIFNKLIGLIGGENLFLFITALVSLIGVYFSIRKYSKDYFLSVFLYITMHFYIFIFSGLRQAIAFSIVWVSLKYIIERKCVKFVLLVLLASTFHKTALIFLPMYFIATKKITKRYMIVFLTTFILLFVFRVQIFSLITKFIYTNYSVSQDDGGYKYLILLFAILIFSLFIRNRKKEDFMENDIFINMIMIAILIQSMSSVEGNIARLTMYYSYSMIFLIPNLIKCIEDKRIRVMIKSVIYIFLLIYFIINIQNGQSYIPYKTFLL